MNIKEMVNLFSKVKPNATFVSIREYKNNFDEIANFNIVFNIDYQASLKRSLDIMHDYSPRRAVEEDAKYQLISSFERSLAFETPLEDRDFPYIHFKDANGRYIKGIKAHEDTDDLYMFGFLVSKKILVPGNYKESDRSELVIVKNTLAALTPVSKFRQFKLIPNSYKEISVQNFKIRG